LLAVPKILAGFMYGMTTDNHLLEIEACYDGAKFMVPEVETAIKDFKHGGKDWEAQAGLQLGIVALQIPKALKTCKNMQDDIAAIEKWATIFTDIPALTKKVTKNFALHPVQSKADIAKAKSDEAAGAWFALGEDLAALATLLIGPIKPVYPSNTLAYTGVSNFDFVAIPDFMAGLMYGFTGKNHLDEMHTCIGESKVVLTGAKQILADAEAGHMIKAAKGAKALVSDLKTQVAGCKNMSEEMKAIEAWAEMFAEPKSLFKTMGKNYLKNNRNIKNDIANEKADWAAGAYFRSGIDVADLLV